MGSTQRIDNAIHQSIKVTIDYPDKHSKYRLPVLNTVLWLETKNNKVHILHYDYAKTLAFRYIVQKNIAMTDKTKFNILIADLVKGEGHIQHLNHRIQFSGYSKRI